MGCAGNVLWMALLMLGIGASHQLCWYGWTPRAVGSFWPCPWPHNRICECLPTGAIAYHTNLGHCWGQGDVHYRSFDAKYFDFQGVCRYILARDCCGKKFTIAIEQLNWLFNTHTSISNAFTIRFGNYVIELKKTFPFYQLSISGGTPISTIPYNDPNLRVDLQGAYIFISLKQIGVWFRWEFNWVFDVWVKPSYQGQTCGICADFNGNANNDLSLTPSGDPVTNIRDWGISWRTFLQPSRCANGHEPPHGRKKRALANNYHEICKQEIMGGLFGECLKEVKNIDVFIANCVVELEACHKNDVPGCMAFGLGSIIKECQDNGHVIKDGWKEKHGSRDCQVRSAVYGHWMTWVVGCDTFRCENGRVVKIKSTCTATIRPPIEREEKLVKFSP